MPPLSSAKAIESITQQFESIDAYLQAVYEILQEGHMPDIADLDDRVARLCSSVEKAPLEIQKDCLKRLDTLMLNLNNCESSMVTFQKNLPKKV
ncbi:MAG: hypothetical protein WC464_02765 [Bdellovibrionales bacterium]